MEPISLAVSPRNTSVSAKNLRKTGAVPGVMYGNDVPSTSIQCSLKDLRPVFKKAGENTLVEVQLDGKKIPCLIHAVSFEPVTGDFEHIDFYAVNMSKKVTANVPLLLTGESPAVKGLGAILVTVHHTVSVQCLPKDLPRDLTLDISTLENFRDSITVSKLTVPPGVVIVNAPDTVLVTVQEPRKEEVITPAASEAAPVAAAEGGTAAAPSESAAPAAEKKDAGKEKK